MSTKLKHIVKLLLIILLIMCWGISLGYANSIKSSNKTINFYFENSEVTLGTVDELKKLKKDVELVGWKETSLETITNPNLNRVANNLKVLFVKGKTSILVKSTNLFEDDKNGCLIDEDTAYKLFGSLNAVGNEIKYYERVLTVRGIHNDVKANVIMFFEDGKDTKLDGITVDSTNLTSTQIQEYKVLSGFKELPIEGSYYSMIASFTSMLFPILAFVLILISVIRGAIKVREKPVFLLIYVLLGMLMTMIFFGITKIAIKLPLDMIPNKWSDFQFWTKLSQEYADKFKYVVYMKKYGVDIYKIENLFMSSIYSIYTLVLFIISLVTIKIRNIKELIILMGVSILTTFAVVILVYYKYGFDINLAMVWTIYPLYYCGVYLINYLENFNMDHI